MLQEEKEEHKEGEREEEKTADDVPWIDCVDQLSGWPRFPSPPVNKLRRLEPVDLAKAMEVAHLVRRVLQLSRPRFAAWLGLPVTTATLFRRYLDMYHARALELNVYPNVVDAVKALYRAYDDDQVPECIIPREARLACWYEWFAEWLEDGGHGPSFCILRHGWSNGRPFFVSSDATITVNALIGQNVAGFPISVVPAELAYQDPWHCSDPIDLQLVPMPLHEYIEPRHVHVDRDRDRDDERTHTANNRRQLPQNNPGFFRSSSSSSSFLPFSPPSFCCV